MKTKIWHYTVEGKGVFPTDMLRYNYSWPRDDDSVSKLNWTLSDEETMVRYRVHLGSIVSPTAGRWNSFGWKVVEQKQLTIDI